MEDNTLTVQENKPKGLGFGAGLGIGLGIGAVIIVITVIILIGKITSLQKYESEILDYNAKQKIKVLEQVIDNYYYDYKDEPVSLEDMRTSIYKGMVDSLNDPYSEYYTAEEIEEEYLDTQGIYYGIGAYISLGEDEFPFFPGIIKNTPAEACGLRAGDVIIAVDGESAHGMSLDEVVSRVKGEEGTVVHLTLYREGLDDYMEVDVTRAAVETQSVSSEMLDGKIGYIQITSFEGATVNQFISAYDEIRNQRAQGLILDLRSNTGGLVSSVVDIAREMLPEGVIVYEEDKNGIRKDYTCDGTKEIDIPLVVLVNDYTASASEILTGAIKDYKLGTVVGTTTFGKGIVQTTKPLSDGSAIKLTVSAYFSPNGINIQGTGIEPDIVEEFDADAYYNKGYDNQLNKAIEVMQDKLK